MSKPVSVEIHERRRVRDTDVTIRIAGPRGGTRNLTLAVSRVRFDDCRVHNACGCDPWVYCYLGGRDWPGTASPEWIEYVPEGA